MTLEEKIIARSRAVMANYNRKAIGLVIDYKTYNKLRMEAPMYHGAFIPMEHASTNYNSNEIPGDTYMGLDVAITRKPNTLIVY